MHFQPSYLFAPSLTDSQGALTTAGDPTPVVSQPNTDRTNSARVISSSRSHSLDLGNRQVDPDTYARNSRRGVWFINALLAATVMSYITCYIFTEFNEFYHFFFFFGILIEVIILTRWRQVRGLAPLPHDAQGSIASRAAARRAARRRAADEEMGINNGVSLPTYRSEAGPDEQCFPDAEMPPPNYIGMTECRDEEGPLQMAMPAAEESEADADARRVITEPPPQYWVAIAGLAENRNGDSEARRGSADEATTATRY